MLLDRLEQHARSPPRRGWSPARRAGSGAGGAGTSSRSAGAGAGPSTCGPVRRPASAPSVKRSIDSSTRSLRVARREEREASPVVEVLADGHPRVEPRVAGGEQADRTAGMRGGACRGSRPHTSTRPASGAMIPATIRSSVVFPAPFSPVSHPSSPAPSSRSMSRSTGCGWRGQRLVTELIRSTELGPALLSRPVRGLQLDRGR